MKDDYKYPLSEVLGGIKRVASVKVVDYHDKGEWFILKSRIVAPGDLFARLERNWKSIVGTHADRFALLSVAGGQECGVWLHYFPTKQIADQYAPGCHQLESWV